VCCTSKHDCVLFPELLLSREKEPSCGLVVVLFHEPEVTVYLFSSLRFSKSIIEVTASTRSLILIVNCFWNVPPFPSSVCTRIE